MPLPRVPRRLSVLLPALLALWWIGLNGARCFAHPANFASATAKVGSDRTFTVDARFDLLAFALNDTPTRIGDAPMNALLDGPSDTLQAQLTEAANRFRHDFQASGATVDTVTFPTLADVQKWRDNGQSQRLPVMESVTVTGHLDPGAKTIAFRFPQVLGMVVLTTEIPYQEPTAEPLDAGAMSTAVSVTPDTPPALAVAASIAPPAKPISLARPATPVLLTKPTPTVKPASAPPLVHKPTPIAKIAVGAPTVTSPLKTGDLSVPAKIAPPPPIPATLPMVHVKPAETAKPKAVASKPSAPVEAVAAMTPPVTVETQTSTIPDAPKHRWATELLGFVKMGFTHIVPEGLDHILFVLGLFLLSTKAKPLLWQITAFTVAHSLTLGLALYGIVRLPPSIVEPIIAASIAFVAIENICTTELKPWRPFVVFAFGLVHGMGFAGALKDLGLQKHDFFTALVGFNVGVELGQLSVVALAFLCVGWFRKNASYRKIVVVPASLFIAAVAIFWTIQRTI